ncbi:Uncharacterized protein APZ42_019626 [Daphnia magna]|uniref:Uncharacterized protein n=1 Tax=Daphnia magna TaxID=35525 RepID=A0A0P5XJY0_9CRUS|nr:Uncharacterized protein APZ42_019626 [Daphnia magna]
MPMKREKGAQSPCPAIDTDLLMSLAAILHSLSLCVSLFFDMCVPPFRYFVSSRQKQQNKPMS